MSLREWANRTFREPKLGTYEWEEMRSRRPPSADPNYYDPESLQATLDRQQVEYGIEQVQSQAEELAAYYEAQP